MTLLCAGIYLHSPSYDSSRVSASHARRLNYGKHTALLYTALWMVIRSWRFATAFRLWLYTEMAPPSIAEKTFIWKLDALSAAEWWSMFTFPVLCLYRARSVDDASRRDLMAAMMIAEMILEREFFIQPTSSIRISVAIHIGIKNQIIVMANQNSNQIQN